MGDARPNFGSVLDAFGVAATVTPLAGPGVETRVVWHPVRTEERPEGAQVTMLARRRIVSVPRVDVPTLPRGSAITGAVTEGGAVEEWTVDETDKLDIDHHVVVVIPAEA